MLSNTFSKYCAFGYTKVVYNNEVSLANITSYDNSFTDSTIYFNYGNIGAIIVP